MRAKILLAFAAGVVRGCLEIQGYYYFDSFFGHFYIIDNGVQVCDKGLSPAGLPLPRDTGMICRPPFGADMNYGSGSDLSFTFNYRNSGGGNFNIQVEPYNDIHPNTQIAYYDWKGFGC